MSMLHGSLLLSSACSFSNGVVPRLGVHRDRDAFCGVHRVSVVFFSRARFAGFYCSRATCDSTFVRRFGTTATFGSTSTLAISAGHALISDHPEPGRATYFLEVAKPINDIAAKIEDLLSR